MARYTSYICSLNPHSSFPIYKYISPFSGASGGDLFLYRSVILLYINPIHVIPPPAPPGVATRPELLYYPAQKQLSVIVK